VLEAGVWAFLGQTTLVLGALLALQFAVPPRLLGLITGFGAGTLVAAAAFELSVPAFREAGGPVTGTFIAIGSLSFYGIPESVAIAISIIGGSTVSAAMLVAVLISNPPEGMASTPGFVRAGWPRARVLGMWIAIAAMGAAAAAVGYQVLGSASPDVLAAVQAFAAGTILTMLASVMMPTAYADGREPIGLAFVLGFSLLGFLTTIG